MTIDFLSTREGSYAAPFYPAGWDYARIHELTSHGADQFTRRQHWWHRDFQPVICDDAGGGVSAMNAMMGYEIFRCVQAAAEQSKPLALILPVGPIGMYKWAVYFTKLHGVSWKHVHGFNMDEWSDAEGSTTPPDAPGSFQGAMERALYGPLEELTVPVRQRHFATGNTLPQYAPRIDAIRQQGGKLVVVYGIGRACHIAFWEPHFAEEYDSEQQWRSATHRLAAKLHPLTIEQNALHTFASRMTLIPLFANTIGPGLFTQADYCIGGAEGAHGPLNWQSQPIWMTLRYGTDPWVPSSYMPTMPGRLFAIRALAAEYGAHAQADV